MLAKLLRITYGFQMLLGGLVGVSVAVAAAQHGAGPAALWWIAAGMVLVPLLILLAGLMILFVWSANPGEWGLGARAFVGEVRAAVRVFWLRQPWASRHPAVLPARTGAPRQVPVLLVHGFLCNHRVWDDVARALHQAGHAVLALNLEPPFAALDDHVPTIESGLKRLQAETGAKQVALVGHSMGGLVIRAWLRKHGAARVARIVTLGSPHQGTAAARWSITPNGRQMRWHSDWLQQLERMETPGVRRLMHLALTPQDNVVFPQRAQQLPGASMTEFAGLGHLQLCLEPTVIAWLLQQLRDLPANAPKKAPRG